MDGPGRTRNSILSPALNRSSNCGPGKLLCFRRGQSPGIMKGWSDEILGRTGISPFQQQAKRLPSYIDIFQFPTCLSNGNLHEIVASLTFEVLEWIVAKTGVGIGLRPVGVWLQSRNVRQHLTPPLVIGRFEVPGIGQGTHI